MLPESAAVNKNFKNCSWEPVLVEIAGEWGHGPAFPINERFPTADAGC